jgi:hypothetical protein
MKIFMAILLCVLAANVSAKLREGERFAFTGDLEYSGFCEAIVNDNLDLLKTSMSRKVGEIGSSRKEVLRKLVADNGMTCNGVDLIEFSRSREADEVHAYLTQKN